MGISMNSQKIMHDLIIHAYNKIVFEAINLTEIAKSITLSSREIQTGVRLVLPGELAKHAVSEGCKAVTKYVSSGPSSPKASFSSNKKRRTPIKSSRSGRAGLIFPVGRIHRMLKQKSRLRVGVGAPVYLSAVLEYLVAEVLELSGNAARDCKNNRITPRHILLALGNDEELNKFFLNNSGIVPNGGVVPHISSMLLGLSISPSKEKADTKKSSKYEISENDDEDGDDEDDEDGSEE